MPTKIPYAQKNWETVGGCDKIKSGCKNCYAVNLIHRFSCNPIHKGRYEGLVYQPNWTGKIKLFNDRLEQPLHRTIPTTYFVNSRSDTFHKDVPFEFIDKIMDVVRQRPDHTFMFFTKRWDRALAYYRSAKQDIQYAMRDYVHLYFSASTQAEVNEAVPILLQIPVAVRGMSLEPLLGPIYISEFEEEEWRCDNCGEYYSHFQDASCNHCGYAERHSEYRNQIDSIIVGCESGPNRRPCKTEWIESIVNQRQEAEVPVYVKQMEIDGKVCSDMSKFPKGLRVRSMPE